MIKKNIFSISVALIILILSLISGDNFQRIPAVRFPGIDKVAHLGMYFFFSMVLFLENRKKITTVVALFKFSLVPLFFGLIMELLQQWLTTTRSGSIFDMVFNMAGILLAMLLFYILRSSGKPIFR